MTHARSARVHRWSELPPDRPMERLTRRRVVGMNAMLSRLELERGFELGVHSHDNEQIAVVVSGRVRFMLGDGEQVELVGGEVLHLPPGVPHGAFAVEDSVILDVFSPTSEGTGVDEADAHG